MAFIPKYILILFLLIAIDYFMGLKIEKAQDQKKKKKYFLVSIASNIGILFLFKYFNFFNENITHIAQFFHWNYSIHALKLILPIGLSFHTFQSLSYIIEVYFGRQKAEKNIWVYALYVLFFPQLVAGPIERPQNLLHQFHEEKKFRISEAVSGLRLMLWGFFKKIVIADNIALLVSAVYTNPSERSAGALVVATVLFAFQIYCDFSGYSDIARGVARMLGFHLMKNFESPYLSASISEFWKRWHISLSGWFRDYVYIPLGGNRKGMVKTAGNLFITFMVSGLWHGANWTFIIWGGLHGFYLVASLFFKNIRERFFPHFFRKTTSSFQKFVHIIFTFILVDIGWVFFRANSFYDAVFILKKFPQGIAALLFHIADKNFLRELFGELSVRPLQLGLVIISIFILLFVEFFSPQKLQTLMNRWPRWMRYGLYYAVILWIFFVGHFGELPFIYFQF